MKTLPELIQFLPSLPPKLKQFGLWWLAVTRPPAAEPVLLRMLHDDPASRWQCAHTLGTLERPRSIREFVRIGNVQLTSSAPESNWLETVIQGLKYTDNDAAVDVLVTIYERTDLPGWLRGDAGDALGCRRQLSDRRTTIFRRTWSAALKGLDESDIEVQFWSMYVIMQLAQNDYRNANRSNDCFKPALRRLREIAKNDHRLAPEFWWPMCEEAKDALFVIRTGNGRENDAGERWLGHPERGPCTPRD